VRTRRAVHDTQPVGIAAIGALAYVLCDLLHELAHVAATLLPLGVKAVVVSTVGVSSFGESPVVSAAGPVVNLALGLALWLVRSARLGPAARYAAWLFGSVNLFNGTAYLLYSALLGSGDWAVVFGSFAPVPQWRPLAGLAGAALYAASLWASLRALRHLLVARVLDERAADRCCSWSYWVGGAVLVLGSLFNPVSPWLILTSGAATGFGAMTGLWALPPLLRRVPVPAASSADNLHIGWRWIAVSLAATIVFVGLFGPGVRLA
jgi:hypothetical protein